MSVATDHVYRAIADPTRRAILDLLLASDRSVKELTSSFSMSQPAISQHLRELRSANLVSSRRVHRENRYQLTAVPLSRVISWLDGYRRFADPVGHLWAIRSSADPGKE